MLRTLCIAFALLATAPIAHATADTQLAASPAPAVDAGAEPKKQICTRERPVGSNRPVRVCRDAAAMKGVTDASQDAWNRALENRYQPPQER